MDSQCNHNIVLQLNTNRMKSISTTLLVFTILFSVTSIGQNIDVDNDSLLEKPAVIKVMKNYIDALQNLTTEGTYELFAKDSQIFESGGEEGSYENYIEHHLGPELGHFKSFTFSDYNIDVNIDLPYAFTTETYVYTIVLNPGDNGESRTINKKGVSTSILMKTSGTWKIIKTHSSSRNN